MTAESPEKGSEKVRIDRWLNAARIYGSRELAQSACEGGKVEVGGAAIKPSRMVGPGDEIRTSGPRGDLLLRVVRTAEKRLSPPLARELYDDLTPEEQRKKKPLPKEIRKMLMPDLPKRERGEGRPTKKERRDMDKWRE